jgi:hypothetical protein
MAPIPSTVLSLLLSIIFGLGVAGTVSTHFVAYAVQNSLEWGPFGFP